MNLQPYVEAWFLEEILLMGFFLSIFVVPSFVVVSNLVGITQRAWDPVYVGERTTFFPV
jgi:hypothetical protein